MNKSAREGRRLRFVLKPGTLFVGTLGVSLATWHGLYLLLADPRGNIDYQGALIGFPFGLAIIALTGLKALLLDRK